jgi:hypothetical protein
MPHDAHALAIPSMETLDERISRVPNGAKMEACEEN